MRGHPGAAEPLSEALSRAVVNLFSECSLNE